ncbi:SIS domain-containing protein [Jiella avicenniae]|uniref:Glutamine--fructose-6-phosphate aminotransferase [isomerizing] n=1 Tax=Jiella avicenniae TaxID=2907202 RepID=A0A9X1P1R9_9HYPH|nr:SIS domain-containing protein [Jiella avicenniae]MCE7027696.1 SIS domain-containing protein [Jiella avicenniae]MCE7028738.1 SIS domain-containing protein [Jiella avicenniae]
MSYRSTVARQTQSLADSLAAARSELAGMDLSGFGKGLTAVTGIGASFAAAVIVASEMQRRGKRAVPIRAVDMAEGRDLADSIIALSHRGRSVETVDALRKLPNAESLAITNSAESPLAEAADHHVTQANGADATPSSTGYTATLLVAGLVLDAITGARGADWDSLPEQATAIFETANAKMDRLGRLFANRRAIDCVGAGAALGTADEASLLIREASRIPAAAYDTRHYLHGPMESMDETTGVVIFGNGRELELARQLDEIGCPALLITGETGIADGKTLTVIDVPKSQDRVLQAIYDIFAPQLLAATLSDAAGLTDTKFRYKQSDTKILDPAD